MAFSIKRMFSNINYFKKSEDTTHHVSDIKTTKETDANKKPMDINIENVEPDSTMRFSSSLKLPESLKNYAAKKGSFSDTDLLDIKVERKPREKRRKCKKLKVDIKKASQSMKQINYEENTPKHVLLDCQSSEIFNDRFKGFDFNKSFEIYDTTSDERISIFDDELESLSEDSDDFARSKSPVKMCRKIDLDAKSNLEIEQPPSVTPESFDDLEKSEGYATLVQNYMMKLEELEDYTKKLLNDFQFHIDITKVFSEDRNDNMCTHKILHDNTEIKFYSRGPSPAGSWQVINKREGFITKSKLKNRLLSIRNCINEFVHENLNRKRTLTNSTYNLRRYKKKIKHYDFPDLRDAFINLFNVDDFNVENASDFDESDCSNCHCKCHQYTPSQSDSGLTTKSQDQYTSITSSIGNFTLDSTTLTAYSESLDQIVSYNSFEDTSLYNTLLQKAAIERITFYVQVHSIQLKCENEHDQDKCILTFHCGPCKNIETEENGLLRHILSQSHCEKIHFVYKTAYIKKCVSAGKEIQPSTVLNPMTMYRDDNKIVCFGDALYACSLCFENLIIGESVLMAHCADPVHVGRRERLSEIVD